MSQSNEPLIYNGTFYLHRVVSGRRSGKVAEEELAKKTRSKWQSGRRGNGKVAEVTFN